MNIKKIAIFVAVIMCITMFTGCNDEPDTESGSEAADSREEIEYNKALEYIADSQYYEALDIIISLGDYKDCKTLRENFVFKCTKDISSDCEIQYTYDENGNKLTYELISDILPYEKTTYVYNNDNQCIEEYHEGYGGGAIWKHTYDASGNLLCSEVTGEVTSGKYEYEYDSEGNCVKEHQTLLPPYHNEIEIIYSYDADGKCTGSVETDMNSNVETTSYAYDSDGNCIREERKNTDWDMVTEYTYNSDGYCEKEVVKMGGSVTYETLNTHDKYGNVISKEYRYEYGDEEVYEYEYELFYIEK